MRTILGILIILAALGAGTVAARAADADLPPAPVVGEQRILGSLDPAPGGGADTDDLRVPLLAGERLAATLTPGPGLVPSLSLLDPSGSAVAVPVAPARGGGVALAWTADRPGAWTLRIEGSGGSAGAYTVRVRVRGAPRRPPVRGAVGGHHAPLVTIPVSATDGAGLSFRLRGGKGGSPRAVALLSPSGEADPAFAASVEAAPGGQRLPAYPLLRGAGTYRLVLEAPEPGAEVPFLLSARVAPPPRPSGLRVLDPGEPRIGPLAAPLVGVEGATLRIPGTGFSTGAPPRVLLDGRPAVVLSVAPGGTVIEVLPPTLPAGALASVTVVNPDGQGDRAAAAYRHPVPAGVRLLRVLPAAVEAAAGTAVTLTAELDRPAPAGGLAVTLALDVGLGAVPATVVVPPFHASASFVLAAGPAGGEGRLRAEAGRSVEVPVLVHAPPPPPVREVDLSGWSLVQTSSSKTLVLPAGTVLSSGSCLVVARSVGRDAFEAFWGGTLPAGTAHVDGGAVLPVLNGDETFRLVDPSGATVDGPTPALIPGRVYARIPGRPADEEDSWVISVASPATATPGAAPAPATPAAGPWISEIADPGGAGQYPYEYVEIRLD